MKNEKFQEKYKKWFFFFNLFNLFNLFKVSSLASYTFFPSFWQYMNTAMIKRRVFGPKPFIQPILHFFEIGQV